MAGKASKKSSGSKSKRSKSASAASTIAKTKSKGKAAVRRAASKIVETVKRTVTRTKKAVKKAAPAPVASASSKTPRRTKREPDIPLNQIENSYIPAQTSLKGPLRASGADREKDQEFAGGIGDDRWNDEDRLTNKSGDPRIGTHGRTYEPGEARTARTSKNDKR